LIKDKVSIWSLFMINNRRQIHSLARRLGYIFSLCFLLLAAILTVQTAKADTQQQDGNLLQNPGFEGKFKSWNSIPEIQVAARWTPWWFENPTHEPAYFRPEYKRAVSSQFSKRVLSGDSAQQWFTFHASHLAGMYQQVFDVIPGQSYRFSIFAQVWSSIEDNPNSSVFPANPHLRVGIDPTGNWDPASAEIIWSGDASMSSVIDQWGQISIEAVAQNDVLTVFMRTNPDFANKHNDMYWDNASLVAVGPATPTTAPSTNTPTATDEAGATRAPIPTNTSTATQLPPTMTPSSTNTASPMPTLTATNTKTPIPTSTPSREPPTASPMPSSSPLPSPSATITASPSPTLEATAISAVIPTPIVPTSETVEEISDHKTGPELIDILAIVGVSVALGLLAVVLVLIVRRRPTA
jgi:hypothetical protein